MCTSYSSEDGAVSYIVESFDRRDRPPTALHRSLARSIPRAPVDRMSVCVHFCMFQVCVCLCVSVRVVRVKGACIYGSCKRCDRRSSTHPLARSVCRRRSVSPSFDHVARLIILGGLGPPLLLAPSLGRVFFSSRQRALHPAALGDAAERSESRNPRSPASTASKSLLRALTSSSQTQTLSTRRRAAAFALPAGRPIGVSFILVSPSLGRATHHADDPSRRRRAVAPSVGRLGGRVDRPRHRPVDRAIARTNDLVANVLSRRRARRGHGSIDRQTARTIDLVARLVVGRRWAAVVARAVARSLGRPRCRPCTQIK